MPGDGVTISASLVEVRIDVQKLADFMRTESGPAYQQLIVVGEAVKQAAIREAPVSKPDPVPRRRPVTPGRLRDSIVKRMGVDGRGVYCRVGSGGKVPYAQYVHEGTNPHPIDAKAGGPLLTFWAGGGIVRTRHVEHPGTQPNRYLTRAAIEVLGAANVSRDA